jgi:hypothetical protein
MNVVPQMISEISNRWKRKLAEFEAAVEGKDPLLVEAYSYLTKIQLRNCVKFCETVINDCGAYVQIKKVERKPRKVRAVPPEKRAAKFKHHSRVCRTQTQGFASRKPGRQSRSLVV